MLPTPTSRSSQRRTSGFTLIELLVVIAIIAILTAIIFPVFATLRENARQKTSMANMEQMQAGLARYKLDTGRYPAVLFGYAVPNASMTQALAAAQQQYAAAQYFPGLYPEYINDTSVFYDGNNTTKDLSARQSPDINKLCPSADGDYACNGQTSGTLVKASNSTDGMNVNLPHSFYTADAYDMSPKITGPNQIDTNIYVTRYQTSWTSIDATDATNYGPDSQGGSPYYNRQLRWTNPPADAMITCTTYHVPNANKVLVVWENGSAKALDVTRFLNAGGGSDSSTIAASGGDSAANFWKVSPNHP